MSLDLEKLKERAATVAPPTTHKYPKPVAGRVAHIDADFMAYQVSAESKEELDPDDPTKRKTLDDMKHNALQAVDHIRQLAAAETAVLHTTHNSDKGGRDDQAILKPYQANRADKERPLYLSEIKLHLSNGCNDTTGVFTGINHTDQEADDGMAQGQFNDPVNAIVCSMDKDLLMVPGWKLNMYDYSIRNVTDKFGEIELDRSKSSTKVVGVGTKFFWAQMLMGDTADNISGVPLVPGKIWQSYAGTKAYSDTYNQFIKATDKVAAAKLEKKLFMLTQKPKSCGPVLTYEILKDARDDKECWETIKACYTQLEQDHGYEFKHWKTGQRVTPTQAILSEMKLLWMRRTKDSNDVVHWLKGVLNAT